MYPLCPSVLIANPAAASGRMRKAAPLISEELKNSGFDAELRWTSCAGDGVNIARNAVNEGFKSVIAMGGDGTLREVAGALSGTGVPMGVIPSGTANVFSRIIGLGTDKSRAVKAILNGNVRDYDLGYADEEPFLLMIGAGMDALAIRKTSLHLKRHMGPVAYFIGAIKALFSASGQNSCIRTGAVEESGAQIIVANCNLYGGWFRPLPEASPHDGFLDVLVSRADNRLDIAVQGIVSLLGLSRYNNDIVTFSCDTAELGGDSYYQLDGDLMGRLPVKVTLKRNALKVIVP